MSNVNIIFCKNHIKRKAYRYCEECKEFICNSCAFQEKHKNHLQKIKSLSDKIKLLIPNINSSNKNQLSKYIELFHFIINYNSSFMPFDINYIMNLIDDKFDSYINQLMDIKTKFKILIAQKLELINSIFPENEKKVIETQNRMLSILNNEDSDYFQKINTQLEQLKVNKSDQKNMNFIEKYNSLIKMAFDDENDFNMKYNLYLAQKEIEKNNKSTKESILDKMLEPYFNEAAKNLQNIYQKINKQNNTDLDNLKKKYDDLLKNPGKNEIEDEEKEEEIKNDVKLKAIPEKKIFPKKINEEPKKIIKEEPKKITTEKPKQKIELLQIEFEPPKIEYNRVRKKELEAMKQENDEEFESKFLKIEEDGDDGLLLAKIIDGKDIDQDHMKM